MKATILRNMIVMGDGRSSVQFRKSTKEKPFEVVSDAVYSRLKRAGAAEPYRPTVEAVEEKPEVPQVDDDMTKAQLVAFAEEHKIEVDAGATKAVIIGTINAALAKAE